MIGIVEHRGKTSAGSRRALRAAIDDAGLEPVRWVEVKKAKKAQAAVTDLVADGVQAVVVCGGDGTVRAAAQALLDTGVALAVLPTGTANLFAGGLGLATDPAAVVRSVRSGPRRTLDTGECNDRTFTVMAGTGVDAGMIDKADAARGPLGKKTIGALSYFWAGATEAHAQARRTARCRRHHRRGTSRLGGTHDQLRPRPPGGVTGCGAHPGPADRRPPRAGATDRAGRWHQGQQRPPADPRAAGFVDRVRAGVSESARNENTPSSAWAGGVLLMINFESTQRQTAAAATS